MPASHPKPGTGALRKGRFSGRNHVYHVTSCTFDRRQLFKCFESGRSVVVAIGDEENEGHIRTLAFVVMSDHLHWLFQAATDRPMSIAVNNVKSFSAKRINKRLGRAGSIWQKGFHDRVIRRDEDIVVVARYIVANPLRARIVQHLGDYPLWDAVWV